MSPEPIKTVQRGITYQLYVDESCHLENDGLSVMCIGYLKTSQDNFHLFKEAIKKIKHSYNTHAEIKWSTVSASRLPLYKKLIDYFFENEISFRCILIKHKETLKEKPAEEDAHDKFYYNMIFHLLNSTINPIGHRYRVYLDIKDTRGRDKLEKIYEKLNDAYDKQSPFIHFQHIHSMENVLLQLTDLFIGAVTYKSRQEDKKPGASKAKIELLYYLESKAGYFLDEGTEPWEEKFNIYDHQPKKG